MPEVTAIDYDDDYDDATIPGYISARLMAAYDFPGGHTLHMHAERRDNEGRIVYAYVLEHGGRVIFEGSDFRSGCGDAVDYADAARTLLSFLTLRPGDTDADYFDHYTADQLAWRDEHAEELSMYA